MSEVPPGSHTGVSAPEYLGTNKRNSSPVTASVRSSADSCAEWYVIHCQPLKERNVAACLEAQLGAIVYLPEVRRCFRGRVQSAPLFPRYIFAKVDLHAVAPSRINAVAGVARLVTFGEHIQPVSEALIAELRQRVERLNTAGGLPEHSFHPGDTVRIGEGPLQGLEVVFLGPQKPSARVRILIQFLGCLSELEIGSHALEVAEARPPLQSRRLTRGKGRRVNIHERLL
ncbi:MAG TPA: transcription termination/antitermination NusG family protein [Roseiflexaceae bacterium]|nr:transcription termination/antitermination NusG family protein [Roseiflexaceae bacterium]